jgi:hypothetical protein
MARKSPRRLKRQVNVPLAAPLAQRLDAAVGVLGDSQAKIVSDALTLWFESLPPDTRHAIDLILAIRDRR